MKLLFLCLGVCAIVGLVIYRALRPKNRQAAGHERVLVSPPPPGPGSSKEEVEEYVFWQFQQAIEVDNQRTPEERQRLEELANLAVIEWGDRIDRGQIPARQRCWRDRY